MKNTIIKLTALFSFGALALSGCDNFDEMNVNKNALQTTNATSYVQPITFGLEYALLERSFDVNSQLMQYTVQAQTQAERIYNYRFNNSIINYFWQNIYRWAGNAETMRVQAEKDNDRTGLAIACILKVLTLSHITDAFGDAPYFEAGKGYTEGKFYPAYDSQKEIYRDMFEKLELANELLAEGKDFDALEDYMYDGKVARWRKFGNSLYVRLLMRAALKDESGRTGERLDAVSKLNEIFSYPSVYPVFESRADAANVKFDANVNAQYTPFHNVRAGLWNANMICERLMDEMYDSSVGLKDPRVNFYFDKLVGVPTQVTYNELMGYYDTAGHYRRNVIQDRDHFALMNYSELYFIWAEAAYRGWIPGTPKEYYVKAVSEAVCEWTDDASADLTSFLANSRVSLDALDGEEVLERIMTQKWISNYLVGIESWCDYRRTGYPEMPVKALAANDGILPTRLRYPSDEEFRNKTHYFEAVNGWLGGTNNMTTNVWWADHTDKRK